MMLISFLFFLFSYPYYVPFSFESKGTNRLIEDHIFAIGRLHLV